MSGLRRDKFSVQHWSRGEMPAEDCFVLVPARDPAAVGALRAYARMTPDVVLASELEAWADRVEGTDPASRVEADLRHRIVIWTATLAMAVREGTMSIETALQRIAGHAIDAVRREG